MNSTRRGIALRKLLVLCDDLQSIRVRISNPTLRRETRARLRRQARVKTDQLARDLAAYRFKGPLGVLIREFRFDLVHFQVLAALLQRHFRADSPAIEGRLLLAPMFDNSFDMLGGMELLQEHGALRSSGLVVLDEQEGQTTTDVLEARFRLSEDALDAFRDELTGLVVDAPANKPLRYASNHDYLLDLRLLRNLYQHRSDRVFQQERWDRVHPAPSASARTLTRRIECFGERIERRLRATPEAKEFSAARFFREYGLSREEIVVVVHLLFKELFEGNAYADAADLLRLVSLDELELLRGRRLVHPSGTLVRNDIIQMETLLEGRELTGEVYLSDWAVNYLFGAPSAESSINSDERLEWHLYLKNLNDSQGFFRDLESN
jgi:hypothetical protein